MTEEDTLIISPEGDAILVIKNETGEQQLKLRIRTSSLRAASKVFDALFGPHFAEGKYLDSQNPPEISLEDDPNSIKIICQVLHFRNNDLPIALPAADVRNLAQTADKYEVLESTRLALERWLVPSTKNEDLLLLLEAAMILRADAIFEIITRALILHGATPFVNIGEQNVNDDLLKVLYRLEYERSKVRTRINDVLLERALTVPCYKSCSWTKVYAYNFLECARSKGLRPREINTITVAQAFANANAMQSASVFNLKPDCSHGQPNPDWIRIDLRSSLRAAEAFRGVRLAEIEYVDQTPKHKVTT